VGSIRGMSTQREAATTPDEETPDRAAAAQEQRPADRAAAPDEQPPDRAAAAEEKFAVPVIVAAVASVPAVFLTMFEDPLATAGQVVNYASLAVLTAETAVLFLLARDRVEWLRRHWWIAAVAAASVPAVIFAVGPVQLLRLLRFVGALRIIRVGRIIKAGKILRERAGLSGPLRTAIAVGVTLACAVFVAVVLADPTAQSRQLLEQTFDRLGPAAVVIAGLILAAATFVVWRSRARRED
jgi:CsoR family transcriptional regulator, copper-sensing transcriptional repressor